MFVKYAVSKCLNAHTITSHMWAKRTKHIQISRHQIICLFISSYLHLHNYSRWGQRDVQCAHTHSERSETVKGVFLLLLSFFSSPCLHIFVIISVYFAHLHCRRFRCCCYCRCHHHRCRCRNFSAKKKQQQREKDIWEHLKRHKDKNVNLLKDAHTISYSRVILSLSSKIRIRYVYRIKYAY